MRRGEDYARPGTEDKGPPQGVDEEPQVAGMADHTVDAARHKGVSRLNCHESAEAVAKDKDRPDP